MTETVLFKRKRAQIMGMKIAKKLMERHGFRVAIKIKDNVVQNLFEAASYRDSTNISYEVKTDIDAVRTGNVAITISSNMHGRVLPAGPMISPAEFFIFVIAGQPGAFCIQTLKLRRLIKEHKYKMVVTQGDGTYNVAVFDKQLLLEDCEHMIDIGTN